MTGGGSQLKHISQLFEYVTGMDTRLGYPTEHLANTNQDIIKSPMYATGIGLVMKGFEEMETQAVVTPEAASTGKVITHSKKTRGGFFDGILGGEIFKKGKNGIVEFFSETDETEEKN